MKKIFCVLALSFTTFGLMSCNNDDDSGNSNEEKILGTWKLEKIVYQEEGEKDEVYFPDNCEKKSTTTYNADKTYKTDEYSENLNTNTCKNEIYGGKYSIENGYLIDHEEEAKLKIQEISSNKMLLVGEEDYNSDGKIDYKIIATFIK